VRKKDQKLEFIAAFIAGESYLRKIKSEGGEDGQKQKKPGLMATEALL